VREWKYLLVNTKHRHFGEVQILTDEPVPVTLSPLGPCQLHLISVDDFRDLLHECREFERTLFRVVERRLRGLNRSFVNAKDGGTVTQLPD